MSNTSYPFKENSNVMNVQGGEKKVMKKILTVALSTAMAFSMFASVAFGDTAVTPQQKFDALAAKGIFNGYPDKQAHLEKEMTRAEFAKVITKLLGLKEVTGTLSYKDKGYDAKNWAVPYIEAVTAAGIMQGQDSVKKIFNYNGKVTIQEMATVLTRALKLEIPANPDNNAADWAKGYVQAAIDKGLISKDANFKANASRSQLVEAAYAIDQAANVTFTYKVVDPSNVEFTLSTGEVVKVKLDTPLVANKETEVKFKDAAGNEYTAKVTWVVTDATKVESVSASNLKEVNVKFDGKVNQASAENLASYTLKNEAGNSVPVQSAKLQDDGLTVLLTVGSESSPNLALDNQTEYKLSVNSVKSAGDTTKTVSVKDFAFKPVDGALPTVESVQGLGNKAVKIVFSEPVKSNSSVAGTFKIDGTVVSGILSGSGSRELIVETFTTLSVGKHTLELNNQIVDFAGYQLVGVSKDFEVVEDKTAPTIAEVKNVTLESATVVYSEDVKDTQAKTASNYYWLQGTTKRTAASVEKIDSKTFKVNFSGDNRLPAVAIDLYVTNITDFSGNVIADGTKVAVNPVVDQTRPEVVSAVFNDTNEVKYTFSKDIDLSTYKASNVVLKGSNGKAVTGVGYTVKEGYTGASRTLTLKFSSALDRDTYTLEISGLQDTTALKNTILPYTVTLNAVDQNAPKATGVSGSGNIYYVTFDKGMDVSSTASILNPENYYIKYHTTTSSDLLVGKLPSTTNLTPLNGNKGVIITLPSNVTGVDELTVQGVKSVDGVYLSGFSKTYKVGDATSPITNNYSIDRAVATESKSISVKFNQPVSRAVASQFTINGNTVTEATVDSSDSTVVKLTLASKLSADAGEQLAYTATAAYNLANAPLTNAGTVVVGDSIAPEVTTNSDGKVTGVEVVDGSTVKVTFTEPVKAKNIAALKDNFKVNKLDTVAFEYGTDFAVSDASAADLKSTNGTKEVTLEFTGTYNGQINVKLDNSNGNLVDATAVKLSNGAANDSLAVADFDTTNNSASSIVLAVTAVVTLPTATVTADSPVTVKTSQEGTVYLVKTDATYSNKASLDALVANGDAAKVDVTTANVNKNVTIDSTGLAIGQYKAVAVKTGATQVSEKSDGTVTIIAKATVAAAATPGKVTVTTNYKGTAYLVPDAVKGSATTKEKAAALAEKTAAVNTANTGVAIDTSDLTVGDVYVVVFVDEYGNVTPSSPVTVQ